MKHTPTKTPWSYHDGKIYARLPSFMAGRQDRSVTIAKCDSNEVFMTENISMEELHANGRFIVHAVNMHESLVEALKANAIRFPMEFKTTTKDCTCNQFIDSNSCRHVMALIALKNANVYFGD